MKTTKVDELQTRIQEVVRLLKVMYEERNQLLLENRKLLQQLEEANSVLERHQHDRRNLKRFQ
jgi:regulator of replication initiation timing